MKLHFLALWLVFPCWGVPSAAQAHEGGGGLEREKWLETVVPRMATAEAQLGHARRLKRQMADKVGEDLVFWRDLAVEAYQAVRQFHPLARTTCVEAAFRAGEILRAAGDAPRALEEFTWSQQHGQATEFRARAGLEIGHLHRREGRWREALDSYLEVASDVGALDARREEAWLWVGTVWKALGRREDARTAWRRVAAEGSDALARIQAYDELCLLLLESADLEGATGLLNECLDKLASRALEETQEGERVRNALLRMRIVDELARAIAGKKTSSAEEGTSRNS